jgi:pSer/pThr/pTyr-binding forkhead associated (FHA) protein
MFSFRKKAQLIFGDPIKPVTLKKDIIEIGRGDQNLKISESKVFDIVGNKLIFRAGILGQNVSRNHCKLSWDKRRKRYLITDFSKLGTWKNGEKLRRGKLYVLEHGDKISLGEIKNKFEILYSKRFLF